jgi:hypothetical protein
MFILIIDGREDEGAYSVKDENEEQVLYIFEEEDDATRYALMLETSNYPPMNVLEVDDKVLLHTCDMHGYNYAIITKNDLVIPPEQHDSI